MRNRQVTEIFTRMADILDIQGANYHRIMAYRRAAENVAALGRPLDEIWQAGDLTSIPGVGETLANYEASLAAIRRLIAPQGFRLGQRHVTLSTVGRVPQIRRLAGEGVQITLAVSLHAASDDLRDHLVPVNRRYGLDALFDACATYVERTRLRVSFEWALIEGTNDAPEQAHALADRIHGHELLAHVNLIPLNPSSDYAGRDASPDRVSAFTAVLKQRHVPHTVRVRRGVEIQAGCGQLRQRSVR